ncbi:MAG: hypothetical protein AVDCRST_MAG53-2696, partial [uncultured Solirubrobacteraceae bacterium]
AANRPGRRSAFGDSRSAPAPSIAAGRERPPRRDPCAGPGDPRGLGANLRRPLTWGPAARGRGAAQRRRPHGALASRRAGGRLAGQGGDPARTARSRGGALRRVRPRRAPCGTLADRTCGSNV